MTMTGCGGEPSPDEASDSIERTRASVQEAMRSVAEVAAGAGLTIAEATGSWTTCGLKTPRLEYGAGGTADPGGSSVAETIEAVTAALEGDGWEVENAGTDPEPYGVLVRDDLRASLGGSRRHPGQVSIGVRGPCVDVTEEQDALLGETDQVIGQAIGQR